MRKHVLPTLAVLCLFAQFAAAQDPRLRKAEEAMQLLQYAEAAKLYEELLPKYNTPLTRAYLAEAYRKNQQYDKAIEHYAQIKDWAQLAPEYLLYYAKALLQAASCVEAQSVYDRYLERKPLDARAPMLRDVCAALEQLRTQPNDTFTLFPTNFNTAFHEMAPAYYGNSLVFASNSLSANGEFLDLLLAQDPASPQPPVPFTAELNTPLHEATATFSADMSRIFFTRSREVKFPAQSRVVPLNILTATRQDDGKWSKPESLNLADAPYSAAHPCLSPDGARLYFSSDLPNGFGGKDLYYSDWNGSAWGKPVNLGPDINTEGDELFPSLGPNNLLYFSSDGHLGLGGHDLFAAEMISAGTWGRVQNLGLPFNSEEDDFAIAWAPDGNAGFLSSNRAGGQGGDDIYGFRRLYHVLQLEFTDALSGRSLVPADLTSDCGAVASNPYLRLPVEGCCQITVQAEGYENLSRQICANEPGLLDKSACRIALAPEKIYTLQGSITDQQSAQPLAGAAVHVFDQTGALFAALVSDANGQFSANLPKGKCFAFKVEKGDYFARTLDERICTEGSQTLYVLDVALQPFWISATQARRNLANMTAPIKGVFLAGTPTGSEKAAPFQLQIYYNQFSAEIREDAIPEMQRLLQLLKDNPKVVLEISAHTDARGDASFNQRLSQKRAEAVVKWLTDRGVERNRLRARGYGESRPVNHCKDGITCSEAEHQRNRRTEFRVVEVLR